MASTSDLCPVMRTLATVHERFRTLSAGAVATYIPELGKADPEQFGIFDMHGIDFIKGDFLRDVASLNKLELLPWDCWGMILMDYASLPPDDLSLLDRLADLTCGDVPAFDRVRQLYESDPRLCVAGTIESYVNGNMERIELS